MPTLLNGIMHIVFIIGARNNAFEVEFVTAEGMTVGGLALERAEIRPMKNKEILHPRKITSCAA